MITKTTDIFHSTTGTGTEKEQYNFRILLFFKFTHIFFATRTDNQKIPLSNRIIRTEKPLTEH